MNSLEAVTAFFGRTTLINFVLLILSTVSIFTARGFIARIHGNMFGLESVALSRLYFHYLAQFKVAVIVFSLTPYIALKLMAP